MRFAVLRKFLTILLIGSLSLVMTACSKPQESKPRPPSPVRVSLAKQDQIWLEFSAVGNVVPLEISEVASGAEGKVISYPAREGDFIKAGEPIVKIRSVTLKIRIAQAEALLKEKQAELDRLQSGYRPEEVRRAQATMAAAEAARKYAEARLRRTEKLSRNNAATEDELESAIAGAEQAVQNLAAAQADYELKSSGYREEEIRRAEAARDVAQKALDELNDELGKRTVSAPFDGYLVEKFTDVGEWITKGGAVGTLVDLHQVEVVVNVEETYIGMLSTGKEVDIAFQAAGIPKTTGKIVHIVPRSDWESGSRSFPVRVRLDNILDENGQPKLKEGMLARVKFRGPKREALLVHKDAIVRTGARPVVYALGEDQLVRPVEVKEGISFGEYIEVTADLTPGSKVVSEGAARLRPMQEVRVLEEAAQAAAEKQEEKSSAG